MNPTLVVAFLRQRFSSPMRLGLLVLLTLFPLGGVAITGDLSALAGIAAPIALVLAAGAIGQDVSSGTLQLLLVRPVTRPGYLASRWFAATLGAVGLTAFTLALGVLVLLVRGTPPHALAVVRMLLESIAAAGGHAAVMVMFSTLVGGLGDVGLYTASVVVVRMLSALASLEHWPWLERAATEAQATLGPQWSFGWLKPGTTFSWFAACAWASTVTLSLAVAIARLNRRELSYAAD